MFQRKCFKNQTVWPLIFGFSGPICARAPNLQHGKELSPRGHHDWPRKPTHHQWCLGNHGLHPCPIFCSHIRDVDFFRHIGTGTKGTRAGPAICATPFKAVPARDRRRDTMSELSRREFAKLVGAVGIASSFPLQAQTTSRTIGIQVGAASFVDEGVESVLDRFQRDGNINALFIASFSYGRGIAGRQVPGQPLPDHGKQAYDTDTFYGGSYTKVDPKYFTNTPFKSFRAPDFGDYDVLEAVLPSAKK